MRIASAVLSIFLVSCLTSDHNTGKKKDQRKYEISRGIILTPEEKNVIFAFYDKDYSVIFSYELHSGKAVALTGKKPGLIYGLCLSHDKKKVVYKCITSLKGKTHNLVYISDLSFSHEKLLCSTFRDNTPVCFSVDDSMIFFSSTGDYGNSSPMVSPHPRAQTLFSVDTAGGKVNQLFDYAFYAITSPQQIQDGYLLFTILADEKYQSGPVALDLSKKTVSSITPVNGKELRNKNYGQFSPGLLKIYPGCTPDSIFFWNSLGIRKMDLKTRRGTNYYEQSKEEAELMIKDMSSFKSSGNVILLKQLSKGVDGFEILDRKGKSLKVLVPDYDSIVGAYIN